MNQSDILIVGGGIAGLGCAHTLAQAEKLNFKLVTEDIGGRICSSADGRVSYGAYYIRSDYHHLLPFVSLGRRLRVQDFGWYSNQKVHSISATVAAHPIATTKLTWLLRRFYRRYQWFKKQSLDLPQKEIIESDRYSLEVHQQEALDFIRDHRLECLLPGLISPLIWATGLVDVSEINTSTLLFLLLILILPTHEFQFHFDRLTKPFNENIEIDSVVGIRRQDSKWVIRTKENIEHSANKLVIALPIDKAAGLTGISMTLNPPVNASMVHLKGTALPPFDARSFIVLAPETDDVIIARQADHSWLAYTRHDRPNLNQYFENWEVVGSRDWRPAFNLGNHLIDCELRNNSFLIGDHNAASMEDAFISGVYAANQLLKISD